MTTDEGHFDKGRWVIDVTPKMQEEEPKKTVDTTPVDEMIESLKSNIVSSFDGLLSLTHHIVATENGHKFIEKKVNETLSSLDKEVNDLIQKTGDTIKKYIDK